MIKNMINNKFGYYSLVSLLPSILFWTIVVYANPPTFLFIYCLIGAGYYTLSCILYASWYTSEAMGKDEELYR